MAKKPEPAATEPAATEPAATEPAATEPAATEPAAAEQSASAIADYFPALRRLWARFAAALPADARAGSAYDVREGDAYHGTRLDAPAGIYRVIGADWLIVVAGGTVTSFVPAKMGPATEAVAVPNN